MPKPAGAMPAGFFFVLLRKSLQFGLEASGLLLEYIVLRL